ncbi:hypothetical protein [Desulfosporosinus sp. FKA]|uniref:hypothetical protein n=1 Tax=Desulfosporosinus sp. FKA TaxID=1969834 RepID=UPI000B4A32AC|nr:hypothetical protein [Desulfosporosinus sp. FKA]
MSKQEIASLACKILGIYMIIQGLNVMVNIIPVYYFTPQQGFSNNLLVIIIPFAVLIVFGVLLWPLSNKLADLMVKGETNFHEESGVKASDIQRVSFSVLGLLLFGNSIPKLISELVSFYSMRGMANSTVRLLGQLGVLGTIVQFIIGLGIFLGSEGLVNFLNTIRNAGLNDKKDSNDHE